MFQSRDPDEQAPVTQVNQQILSKKRPVEVPSAGVTVEEKSWSSWPAQRFENDWDL